MKCAQCDPHHHVIISATSAIGQRVTRFLEKKVVPHAVNTLQRDEFGITSPISFLKSTDGLTVTHTRLSLDEHLQSEVIAAAAAG